MSRLIVEHLKLTQISFNAIPFGIEKQIRESITFKDVENNNEIICYGSVFSNIDKSKIPAKELDILNEFILACKESHYIQFIN